MSYALSSKLGSPEEFANMIERCHASGIGVIVDAYVRRSLSLLHHLDTRDRCVEPLPHLYGRVINHMTANAQPSLGSAGSRYTHYEYPGVGDQFISLKSLVPNSYLP